MTVIYGYARVSGKSRDLAAQLADVKAAGCERIHQEKMSAETAERPQLEKLLAIVGQDDVVMIPAVDRLSCDTTDLLVIARDLQKVGAGLRSLAEPIIDTTSDYAEIVLATLAIVAKLERRRIKERTVRRRADAKASSSVASRSSRRARSARRSSAATWTRKRCARLRAATMSVRRRFRGWHH
ncbi:MAG: recombinase family protein [Roseiarcus sp.]